MWFSRLLVFYVLVPSTDILISSNIESFNNFNGFIATTYFSYLPCLKNDHNINVNYRYPNK